jgi:aspartyl protease/SnoaL-like protein
MRRSMALVIATALGLAWATVAAGQEPSLAADEIPLERCDVLPVVKAKIAGETVRLLVDTGATSMLNLKSFSAGRSKDIHVSSWSGTAATSAREVSIPQLELGRHKLSDLKLPAIDLSPIGKACGGQIDGILGVDLLDRMGVTIDLKRQVARLEGTAGNAENHALMSDMMASMEHCDTAFEQAKKDELADCFDPDIVLYTPWGEFRGRDQVMQYLQERYMKDAPNLRYRTTPHDARSFGDALWYSYDYKLDTPSRHIVGHGMAMCRRQKGVWRVLNIHNSLLEPEVRGKP